MWFQRLNQNMVRSLSHFAFQFQLAPLHQGLGWDRLYAVHAPYQPDVTGELDTQNFEHFDEDATMKLGRAVQVDGVKTCSESAHGISA
jgi:hypothetical protein